MVKASVAVLRAAASPAGADAVVRSLFSVSGKNVLITGGSRGIGKMIAETFVAAGANVLLTSRSLEACREAAESIDPQPHYVASNVSSRAGCEALAEHAGTVFGQKLDVLINNAGASWGEPLERTSGKANWGFDKVLDLVRNNNNNNNNNISRSKENGTVTYHVCSCNIFSSSAIDKIRTFHSLTMASPLTLSFSSSSFS